MSDQSTRILIVEDESIVALDLQSLLRRLGYAVCGREASGEGALEAARRERPDLILMDISLSGEMDGITSADTIRQEMDIPVIFLTAYADKSTVERAKTSDAYGYLLKPFQEREIEIAIDMALYKYRTQKELRSQQALLDATLESIPDAVFTLDESDRIAYGNDEAERLFGDGELVGVPFEEAVPLREIEDEGKGGLFPGERVALKLPEGEERLFEKRRGRFENPKGAKASVVVLRDISLQVEYEEQIEAARTAAEQASQAKSEFIANMSHELRTPMNSILGMSQLALELASSGDQREYLGILRRSAEDLFALITNVLDFSRVEAGSLKREKVQFNLDELLEEVSQRYARQARRKGLYLACYVNPDLPMELLGEREWLVSILANLLANGVKFTRRGGIRLEATGELRENAEVDLRLSVIDTGIGVPREAVERVFEPFTQVDPSATRDYGGTGIGLAVVRRLVDHLGGTVEVNTSEGEGTRFDVSVSVKAASVGEGVRLGDPLDAPPTLILWDEEDPAIQGILPWIERWGVPVESGTTVDTSTPGERGENTLLLASERSLGTGDSSRQEERESAPEGAAGGDSLDAFRAAVESGTVLAGLLVGEAEFLGDVRRLHYLGVPPRLRHLRKLLIDLPRTGSKAEAPELGLGLRILVVDDEGVSRLATKKILEKRGHTVFQAGGGSEALDLLGREAMDVVLLDLEMPDMDGWETTRRIREDLPLQDACAILAMTGHSRDQERERARVVGMDDFLSKPISSDLLDAKVRNSVSRRRRALELRNQQSQRDDGGEQEDGAGSSLLERARAALSREEFDEAEEILGEFREGTNSKTEADMAFKAILAVRRHDTDGALLRLDGLNTGG